MPRVVHFEIHADKPERAVDFYGRVLGWKAEKWPGPQDYWLLKTGEQGEPGIDGGLMKRQTALSGDGVMAYVCTVGVDDLDACVSKATQHGGSLAVPRMPVPGIGWLAYCKDPEGNVFGMMQADPDAA